MLRYATQIQGAMPNAKDRYRLLYVRPGDCVRVMLDIAFYIACVVISGSSLNAGCVSPSGPVTPLCWPRLTAADGDSTLGDPEPICC